MGGSECIEALTDSIERGVHEYLKSIDEAGGTLLAIETGYIQNQIHNAAYDLPARQSIGKCRPRLNEVRLHFPDADQYKSLLVFNIRHNYYRLIVKVDYRARLLMVKEFLTHREYTRGDWKKWAH